MGCARDRRAATSRAAAALTIALCGPGAAAAEDCALAFGAHAVVVPEGLFGEVRDGSSQVHLSGDGLQCSAYETLDPSMRSEVNMIADLANYVASVRADWREKQVPFEVTPLHRARSAGDYPVVLAGVGTAYSDHRWSRTLAAPGQVIAMACAIEPDAPVDAAVLMVFMTSARPVADAPESCAE